MLSKISEVVEEIVGLKEMKILCPWVYVPCAIAVLYALMFWASR